MKAIYFTLICTLIAFKSLGNPKDYIINYIYMTVSGQAETDSLNGCRLLTDQQLRSLTIALYNNNESRITHKLNSGMRLQAITNEIKFIAEENYIELHYKQLQKSYSID